MAVEPYTPVSLGEIYSQASQINNQRTQGQLAQIALQNAHKDQGDEENIDAALANPNATLADFAKGGQKGVQAYNQVGQAKTQDALQHYRRVYVGADQVIKAAQNGGDPIAMVHQVAPDFAATFDSVHGHGAFDKLTPDQVVQAATQLKDSATAGLIDPEKQWQNDQDMVKEHYKQAQENARNATTNATSIATNQNTVAATKADNANTVGATIRGQNIQNQENKDRIGAENARAGLNPDGAPNGKFDSTVDAILNYRAAPFTGASTRSGPGASIMAEVYRRDPTYDATGYAAKSGALKSLTSGKDGQTLDATNTAIQHLSQLKGLLSALNSGDIGIINQAKQAYEKATGNPAPTNAALVANIAATEVNKVATGGPGAIEDRDLARSSTQLKGSPEQQSQAMDNLIGLMSGRLNSTRNRFVQAKLGSQFDNMLLPETKAALAAHGYTGSAAPTAAGVPPAVQALLDKYK